MGTLAEKAGNVKIECQRCLRYPASFLKIPLFQKYHVEIVDIRSRLSYSGLSSEHAERKAF